MMLTFQAAFEEEIDLIYQLYRHCVLTSRGSWDDEYPTRDFVEQDYLRQGLMTLKNEQGEIVAAGAITPADELEDLKYSTALLHPLELSRLAVDPQFQGRGYGKLLLQGLMAEVRKRGADGIQLLAAKENAPALVLYRGADFQEKGSCRMYDTDFILFEKKL